MFPRNLCIELREVLERAVRRNIGDSILLSGGLDSSLIAVLASRIRRIKAITVGLRGASIPDLEYARTVAKILGIEHRVYMFDLNEFFEAARSTIAILKTFDPMEVRNSATIYVALSKAREYGWRSIMTGDGGDELFAGYNFLYELDYETMDRMLRDIWKEMFFSARVLGEVLGIDVKQPYLDPEVVTYAKKLNSRLRVGYKNGKRYGKYILRIAFQDDLPLEIIWRRKTPIESGSGTTSITKILGEKVSDNEFEKLRERHFLKEGVKIRDKEQLFYYEIYRELFGPPRPAKPGKKGCPMCRSEVSDKARYCRVCGAYPV